MSDEDWVKAAMTDDSVVVELLFHLRQSTPPPPPPSKKGSRLSLPLEWSVRQRRSKQILHHATAAKSKSKKPAQTARDSPTTPLSWSCGGGATSVSGGCSGGAAAADGFEEQSASPAKRTDAARSKVAATNETTTSKRAKKKKTLAELKEEEILLVKERRHLKREIATLRASVEKQRATNESLKRLKLNFESQPRVENVKAVAPIEASPGQIQKNIAFRDPLPLILPSEVRMDDHEDIKPQPPTPKVSSELQPNQENNFAVPDLNLPVNDNFNS